MKDDAEFSFFVQVCTRVGALQHDGDGVASLSEGLFSAASRHDAIALLDQSNVIAELAARSTK